MSAQLSTLYRDPESVPETDELRFCPMCDGLRPINDFGIVNSRPDGRNRYCRPHARTKAAAYRTGLKGYLNSRPQQQDLQPGPVATPRVTPDPKPRKTIPVSVLSFRVLAALRNGARTQLEIQQKTKLGRDNIGLAIADLLITRRLIGTRSIGGDLRIYFEL